MSLQPAGTKAVPGKWFLKKTVNFATGFTKPARLCHSGGPGLPPRAGNKLAWVNPGEAYPINLLIFGKMICIIFGF